MAKKIKRKYIIILYVFLISCMFIFLWKKSCIQYQTNDDFYLGALCSGLYGENIPYTVFTNIIYGYILSILYSVLPICNWFTALNICGVYVVYIMLGYLLIKKNAPIVGFCGSVLLFLGTYSSLLLQMNWTKFCAFFGMAGFIILAEALKYNRVKCRVVGSVIGVGLILWSSIIRIQAFLLVVPFGLLLRTQEIKGLKGILRCLKEKYYKIVFVSFIGIGTLFVVNEIVYDTETWKDYRVFNILDYDFPQYEDYSEEYNEMGYTETDIEFLKEFYVSDTTVFDKNRVDKIEDLVKAKPSKDKYNFLKELIQSFENIYLSGHMASVTILLLVYFIVGDKSQSSLACLLGGMVLLEIIVLHIMGRPIERVISIPLFSCLIFCLFMFNKENYIFSSQKFLWILVIYCLVFSKVFFLDAGQYCKGRTDTIDFLKYIREQKDSLFIWDIRDSRIMEAYDPLDKIDSTLMTNSTYDSGWLSNMPFFLERNGKYADGNSLYYGLVNSDNIYLIGDDNIQLKRVFIENHYGDNVAYSLIESPYGFEIYSINAYLDSDKNEGIQWDICETTWYNEDLFMIRGNVSCKMNCKGYLNLSNANKKYTYQIKIQNGQFRVGIPYCDWENEEEVEVDLLIKEMNELKRSDLQYSICIPDKNVLSSYMINS